jgi:signal transduction histidine kinase
MDLTTKTKNYELHELKTKNELEKMNQHLQNILSFIQRAEYLTAEEKSSFSQSLKEADKELELTAFKLDRTEKVKRTTAILLEETIAELEKKRKAVELQNRELEIEASLERVRAKAMAMQRSEDLANAVKIVFEELDKLDLGMMRCGIGILDEKKRSADVYTTTKSENNTVVQVSGDEPMDIHPLLHGAFEAWSKKQLDYSYELLGEDLKNYYKALFKGNFRLPESQSLVSAPEGTKQYYYNAIFPHGGLFAFRETPFPEEAKSVMKRFAYVFNLTYTRFNDLKQAEAQAREAQIELGLERVRARAMAMQKSDELSELVDTVFKELTKLDFALTWCIINIIDENSLSNTVWAANPDINKAPESYHMLFEDYPFHHAMMKGWKERKTKYVYTLEGNEKKIYDDYLFTKTEFKRTPEAAQTASRAMEKYVVSFSFSNFGGLQTVGDVPLSEANLDILSRFGKVFDLTYTRFNDLKQAEAQARESQIQLALERVRARTMAMQHSDELAETAFVLFEQFNALGVEPERIAIEIVNEKENVFEIWATHHGGSQMNQLLKLSLDEPHVMQKMYAAWKQQIKSITIDLQGKELEEYFQFLKNSGASVQREIFGTRRVQNVATFSKGIVTIITPEPRPRETIDILERFAGVFDGTYTRFLDLQKAEAQAREAQIELALERVRARTMAMQKSDELQEVVHTVFERLRELNVDFYTSIIILFTEGSKDIVWWFENKENQRYAQILIPYSNISYLRDLFEARESGTGFFSKYYSFEEKNELFDHLFNNTVLQHVPDQQKKFLYETRSAAMSVAIATNTGIHLTSYTRKSFSEQENEILKRFAKVFDQAYTRFLDLQKAEAQAKEAKIEAALERVRSRSMGMQKSEELKEVIQVVYEQFVHLSIPIEHTGFIMDYKTRDDMHIWLADQHEVPAEVTIPYFDCAHWNSFNEARKKGIDFFANHLDFEEKNKFYRDLFKLIPGLPEEAKEYYLTCPGLAISTVLLDNVGLYIENFSGIPYTDEENNTLMRFGKVFQQTYTRFQDLQKAESQAREAKIEASLERVRSRAMAMHNSEDLALTVSLFFVELNSLNVIPHRCGVSLVDKESRIADFSATVATEEGQTKEMTGKLKLTGHPVLDAAFEHWINQEEYHPVLRGDEIIRYYQVMSRQVNFPAFSKDAVQYGYYFSFKEGFVFAWTEKELKEEELQIFRKFTSVLSLTYRRYIDLKDAEAQARESQIQLALERVRARTMAMQHSDELKEAAALLFHHAKALGVPAYSCGYNIWEKDDKHFTSWMSTQDGSDFNGVPNIPLTEDSNFIRYATSKQKGEQFFVLEMRGERMQEHYQYLKTIPAFREWFDHAAKMGFALPETQIHHLVNFSHGNLLFITLDPCPEFHDVFKRFAAVFEQTYTRFLDLQKAEAQAREARIEAVLERVRSRTMAMQKSDELTDVAGLLFEQVGTLGIKTWTAGFNVWSEDNNSYVDYITSPNGGFIEPYTVHTETAEALTDISNARKSGVEFDVQYVEGEKIKELYRALTKLGEEQFEKMLLDGIRFPSHQYEHFVFGSKVSLMFITYEPVPEAHDIFKRLGKVFEQTYTRFLDLQKAEAQAREAQIETALEKVRSRTMAMQKSEELSDTAYILFQQFKELGENPIQITIGIINEAEGSIEFRVTDWSGGGAKVSDAFNVSIEEPTLIQKIYKAWKQKERSIVIDLAGAELEDWIKYRNHVSNVHISSGDTGGRRVISTAFFSKGHITFSTPEPRPMETIRLLERFAGVFDLTYTRFLDLKLAEAQARKERIEAALERVRSSSLAMHKTDELKNVVKVVFDNLRSLGLKYIDAVNINIFHEGSKDFDLWIAAPGQDYTKNFRLPYIDHPIANDFFDTVQKGGTLHKKLYAFEVKNEYFKYTFENSDNKYLPEERKQLVLNGSAYSVTAAIASHSSIFVHNYNGEIFSPEDDEIILRFSQVFDQAYKRYLDLQKAELLMRDAVKQASLDRIRGQVASMRSTEDLKRITPLIWQELGRLEIPFIRCGVFIMDDAQAMMQAYLSKPNGESLGVLHLTYGYDEITKKTVDHWRRKEVFRHHWTKSEFVEWMQSMIASGQIENMEDFQGGTTPPESLDLHFIPFEQGMLYVGAIKPLSDYELNMVNSLAEAFSVAYSRYEDFTKLEKAKHNIETTLTELKATQSQLIQAEKMASLGELTAGIAHEIQNPLNFVNNFSEVSSELLDEMIIEVENNNLTDAVNLADDVKQNLEKIKHHGKRADEIVKGMLQHSRVSSGVKAPTDINKLTDEYLRLAYHGLRAKDKSFNATLNTSYDENIGDINIISQDMGRVLLNLISNAFYAVNHSFQHDGIRNETDNYEPTVSVKTYKVQNAINGPDEVYISIKDNGPGIPQKVLDKIFQPFFTTKPAGQGTGLGLSLSYDIVKAHGGEIKVKTCEGEGAEFIISLPLN